MGFASEASRLYTNEALFSEAIEAFANIAIFTTEGYLFIFVEMNHISTLQGNIFKKSGSPAAK